jgi:hypothetical protein
MAAHVRPAKYQYLHFAPERTPGDAGLVYRSRAVLAQEPVGPAAPTGHRSGLVSQGTYIVLKKRENRSGFNFTLADAPYAVSSTASATA